MCLCVHKALNDSHGNGAPTERETTMNCRFLIYYTRGRRQSQIVSLYESDFTLQTTQTFSFILYRYLLFYATETRLNLFNNFFFRYMYHYYRSISDKL